MVEKDGQQRLRHLLLLYLLIGWYGMSNIPVDGGLIHVETIGSDQKIMLL